jgi:uncharacterized protein YecA (UPF0149 family)
MYQFGTMIAYYTAGEKKMKSTDWTQLIPNLPKNTTIRKMVQDELDEGTQFLEMYEAAIDKAADYLNREFQAVPKATWKAALKNPDNVEFTDSHRAARFEAAQKWIGTQC